MVSSDGEGAATELPAEHVRTGGVRGGEALHSGQDRLPDVIWLEVFRWLVVRLAALSLRPSPRARAPPR